MMLEAIAKLLEQNNKYEVTRFPSIYLEDEKRYKMDSVEVSADDLWEAIEKFLIDLAYKKSRWTFIYCFSWIKHKVTYWHVKRIHRIFKK